MKTKFYLYACVLNAAVFFTHIPTAFSQCNCGPGVPATALTVPVQTMTPTTASSYTMYFDKFDPSLGTLSCVTMNATLQGESTSTGTITSVDNKALANKFRWQLTLVPEIVLPSFTVSEVYTELYGPDSLATPAWIDSVNLVRPEPTTIQTSKTYGPQNLFVNASLTQTGPASSAYYTDLSTQLEVTYNINGIFGALSGGTNYATTISTLTEGIFELTYYWCPAGVLATNIKNFIATLNNNSIKVEWTSTTQLTGSIYELQVSNDGTNFKTIYIQPTQISNGSAGSYQFLYNIDQIDAKELYFRIKQTDINGKNSFTAINTVSLNRARSNYMGVYPNPVTDKLSLQFEKELDGDVVVDIVNLTGQRVFNREIRISKSKFAQLNLDNPPSRGMYYVRATEKRTGAIYVNKLFMK